MRTPRKPKTENREPKTASEAASEASSSKASRSDRVYAFRCYEPRDPEHKAAAMQLLGQAWLYREDLRVAYNTHTRAVRSLRSDDSAHVAAFERHLGATDDVAHVFAFEAARARRTIQDALNERVRAARARRGHLVDHGTYWLVEEAIRVARKASGLDPIRRKDWDETGRIGAAIQSTEQFAPDRDSDKLLSHKRVSLTRPNDKGEATLEILVGDLRDARHIRWAIVVHRPLPNDAIVKQVAVQRTRNGHRYRWEALFTVSSDHAAERETRDKDARGIVGVDVGWRYEGSDRIRVATFDGADGDTGQLFIDTLEAVRYADAVEGTRDRVFDEAKAFVKQAGIPGAEHAHLWKDKERMARLAHRTGSLGPNWWHLCDKHLQDISSGVRQRALRRRLDVFRSFANMLARRYRILALEDMAISDWVGEAETHAKERKRSVAAVGLLQQILVDRFGVDRVDFGPSARTSMICSCCGSVRSAPVGPSSCWTCEDCGAVHHQDENASCVIRRLSERWIDGGNPLRARTRKPKKKGGKKDADAIATGTRERMVVTSREPAAEAAE